MRYSQEGGTSILTLTLRWLC